ncbi:glycosyltransferase family 4 protein [Bradyrhizobium sp. CW7]|uniref:glycosyltransferase family 4 protein n=1 Tax=Bradyrhizobium sp. CW7 TaxID=2782688 RepID=UPI001FF927F7|nr:glycosyltransferase family 4 protein [Bradyrhizobium sp. CW7]
MNSAGARAHIIAVGQIPPPVTGYAYITARMIETLGQTAEVETINVSPGTRQGLRKHLHKARQTIRACLRLAKNVHRVRFMYLGCEGDLGLIYTVTLTLAARLFGYTILLHHHSFSYIDRASRLMRLILRVGGIQIRHVFLCSTMLDRFEAQYGKVQDSRIVSNAAFVESGAAPKGVPSFGHLRIGLLSNLTREKGLYTFIDLLRRLKQSHAEVQGLLAGPIANEEDKANVAAAEAELGGTLQYVGPVYGEAKDRFYGDIDVFVFPTQYANEAQPTVLFEARAAGNRVIAYDRGCIGSQVGNSGLAIPVGDDFCVGASAHLEKSLRKGPINASERQQIIREFQDARTAALHSANDLIGSTPSLVSSSLRCFL